MSGSGIRRAICKSAPCSRQITMPAPHHSGFYRLDALPVAKPTASKHWRHLSMESTDPIDFLSLTTMAFRFILSYTVRPVKIGWQGVGVVICLDWGADCLHMVQLMPLQPKSSSLASFKPRMVLPFWYWLTQVVPEKRPLNRCVYVLHMLFWLWLAVIITLA